MIVQEEEEEEKEQLEEEKEQLEEEKEQLEEEKEQLEEEKEQLLEEEQHGSVSILLLDESVSFGLSPNSTRYSQLLASQCCNAVNIHGC